MEGGRRWRRKEESEQGRNITGLVRRTDLSRALSEPISSPLFPPVILFHHYQRHLHVNNYAHHRVLLPAYMTKRLIMAIKQWKTAVKLQHNPGHPLVPLVPWLRQ